MSCTFSTAFLVGVNLQLILKTLQYHSPSISEHLAQPKKTPDDFHFGKEIGEGSYSTVYLAKEKSTGREFAVKVLDKLHIIKEKKTEQVRRERDVMLRLDHPFFVRLFFTFQDAERLYFGMNYCKRGELLKYLNKLECFDEECSRFYAAEVTLALEYLHSKNIIHRDLKPENMLLNEEMHIQICDFGSAKIMDAPPDAEACGDQKDDSQSDQPPTRQRKNSFVGTAQYVSPEVLTSRIATFSSDLWALGCITYQFLSGQLPFWGGNEYLIFQKILKPEYEFPQGFYNNAKDLVSQLLVLEPSDRLGSEARGGYQELKSHSFFAGIEWSTLPSQTPPTLMPYLPAKDSDSGDFYSSQTGLDEQTMAAIYMRQHSQGKTNGPKEPEEEEKLPPKSSWLYSVLPKSQEERKQRLQQQAKTNDFHRFTSNNLILHQAYLDKRKGLFARKRMFLLTEGPHLYYVDAGAGVLKGELPWSKELWPECKNFKIFFVHTPNRIYYLEDSYQRNAKDWCEKLQEVVEFYYDTNEQTAKRASQFR